MEPMPVPAAPHASTADVRVPWHASLRTRLMVWVGLLLALLLLAGFAAAFFAARERVVADAEARTRYEARQAADRLDATMRSVRVSGEAMIELSNRVTLTRAELLEAMEAMLDANPAAVGGLVALEPGVLADRAPLAHYVGIAARGVPDRDLLADGYDLAGREWYQRTLQATSPWWSEPYFNETAGGRYMTTLNLPLRDREGRRIGMVSLDVPVQALSSSLESLRTVAGQRTALFAPEGTIAVHPERGIAFAHDLPGYIARAGRSDLAPMEAARAQHRALQFTHADPRTGAVRYSVLQPVGESGWTLQVSLGRDAMLASLDSAMRLLGLIGALVALLAALAVLGLARRITVPLTELTTSAGHFANGEFDWPVPHDARGDEVGVMARALERARDSIRLQLDQIGRYAAEQQKLQSELDIAHGIQMSMLPHDREFAAGERHYRLQARLEPAKAVGGDFHGHFETRRRPIVVRGRRRVGQGRARGIVHGARGDRAGSGRGRRRCARSRAGRCRAPPVARQRHLHVRHRAVRPARHGDRRARHRQRRARRAPASACRWPHRKHPARVRAGVGLRRGRRLRSLAWSPAAGRPAVRLDRRRDRGLRRRRRRVRRSTHA